MAIATASEYKTYAGISGTTYDARLAVILPGVQAEMERVCNRNFDLATSQVEYLDGTDTAWLVLKNAPIYSIDTIKLVTNTGGTVVVQLTYTATAWNIDVETGVLNLINSRDVWVIGEGDSPLPVWDRQATSAGFPRGHRNIQVTYTSGYGTGEGPAGLQDYPADLKMAFYDLIGIRLAQGAKDPTLRSESLGSYSYTNGDMTLTNNWSKLLVEKCAPFKRLGVLA